MARTILAVDDNPADLSRIEKLLSNAGDQVTTAVNGQAALDAVKDPNTKDLPVVLVTAKNQKADKAWGQMLGAKGYITKPYTDADVLDVLRNL